MRFASGFVPAGLVLIGSLGLFVLCGQALLGQPGIPYNLRELIDSGTPGFTLASLGLSLLITGATPLYLARTWDSHPLHFAWLAPLNCVTVAVLVYALVRTAAPYESIGDVIGSPVLNLPAEVENLGRFVGLYVGVLACLTVGVRLTVGRVPGRNDLPGVLGLSVLALFSYLIVVVYACTDNVVELLRGGGNWVAALAVAALMSLLGLVAGAVSLGLIRATEGRWSPLAGATTLLGLSFPLGWLLLLVATTPVLTKYDQTFAAREFLFGPDRAHHLGDRGIFLRFAFAIGSTIGALSIGMLIGRMLLRPRSLNPVPSRSQHETKRRTPVPLGGLQYLLLAAMYLGFAIYGSLVPLRIREVPWAEAWDRFRQIPFLELGIESRSDWVANILLFVPLGFLLAGAFRVDRLGRLGDLLAAACIVPTCALISIAIEFTQIWFPPRTVSQNDIAAEALGSLIGVGIWSLGGRRVTDLVREYARTFSSHRRLILVLQLYLLGLLIYSVLPLDLTISPTHLWRKYREGRVVLFAIGGTHPWESAYVALAKTATFVPVGLLVSLLVPRGTTRLGNMTRGLVVGGALAAVVEMAQLLVFSRVTNGADLLWGALGSVIGVTCLATGPASNATRCLESHTNRAGFWFGLTAAYAAILAVVFWFPFDFSVEKGLIQEKLGGMLRVPFSALYWGTDWNAMTQVSRKVLWFIPLGGLIARGIISPATHAFGERATLIRISCLATLIIAAAIELVQILLPGKIADSTDILLCQAGAMVGLFGTFTLLDSRERVTSNSEMNT